MMASITASFARKKTIISGYFDSFFEKISDDLSLFRESLSWHGRLKNFLSKGKMIRGGLLLITEEFYRGENSSQGTAAGAAMELLQAGLLIHDDIMDRDILRRGGPSLFHQYQRLVHERKGSDPEHTGMSMGMCLGDLAFFLAMNALSGSSSLWSLVTRELSVVSLAQMRDVLNGSLDAAGSRQDILKLYAHKTGRYTFSLPLMAGAILGEAPGSDVECLGGLGEDLGIMFQLKDDEIGMFGDPSETGKPADSDITEGKITCLISAALESAEPAQRDRIRSILADPEPSREDADFVRQTVKQSGALREVRELMNRYASAAEQKINALSISREGACFLRELISYNMERRS
ncbi:MAG: polyprenyl synthetase family protein [Spirochaetia bacterium]